MQLLESHLGGVAGDRLPEVVCTPVVVIVWYLSLLRLFLMVPVMAFAVMMFPIITSGPTNRVRPLHRNSCLMLVHVRQDRHRHLPRSHKDHAYDNFHIRS